MVKVENKKYQLFLFILLIISSGTLFFNLCLNWYEKIPSHINLRSGEETSFDLNVPAFGEVYKVEANGKALYVNFNREVVMKGSTLDSYRMDVRLFGVFPLKSVDIEVIEDQMLIPAGVPVGIYLETDGILVIETGGFENAQGMNLAPADNILQKGDYILAVNGNKVSSKKELVSQIKNCEGKSLILDINRQGQYSKVRIMPALDKEQEYKLGIWIRDNSQGIGTMTFLSENGKFGALGHGIHDLDTGELLLSNEGRLYDSQIISITKGNKGMPGELTGVIDYSPEHVMGTIEKNTEFGIFGECNKSWKALQGQEALPIGLKQEVELGKAQIICTLSQGRQTFDIEIEEMYPDAFHKNRGMLIRVTDQELLNLTGGIIQGMSGSPILQNGRIVGAVTHVLVNDPTKGYGIFIENMLEH